MSYVCRRLVQHRAEEKGYGPGMPEHAGL